MIRGRELHQRVDADVGVSESCAERVAQTVHERARGSFNILLKCARDAVLQGFAGGAFTFTVGSDEQGSSRGDLAGARPLEARLRVWAKRVLRPARHTSRTSKGFSRPTCDPPAAATRGRRTVVVPTPNPPRRLSKALRVDEIFGEDQLPSEISASHANNAARAIPSSVALFAPSLAWMDMPCWTAT